MPSRPTRRRKVTVDSEQVVDTAAEIANRDGLDALSIRTVAAALDINPMSVYRFVESKDDLTESIVVRVMNRFRYIPETHEDWRERVRAAMTRWRALLVANPSVVQVMSKRRVVAQPAGLARLMEIVIGAFEDAGLSPTEAVAAFWQVFTFTFGHVVFEMPRASEPAETDALAGSELARVAAEHGFARVEKMAERITAAGARPTFLLSLDALLSGIVGGT